MSIHLTGEQSQFSRGMIIKQNIECHLHPTCIQVKVVLEVCAGCEAVKRECHTAEESGSQRPEVTGGA